MEAFFSGIGINFAIISLVSIGLSVILFILWAVFFWRTEKMLRRYYRFMQGVENRNMEEMLTSHIKTVNNALSKTLEVESECKAARKMAQEAVQKIGVVRFNAFDNTGSDLSFAIALLDYFDNGIVISSLFGRDESRTYAKPVHQGNSEYNLSDEEREAIRKAKVQ